MPASLGGKIFGQVLFDGLGIAGEALGVTSLHQLGILISMPELDSALKASFEEVFGAAWDPREL